MAGLFFSFSRRVLPGVLSSLLLAACGGGGGNGGGGNDYTLVPDKPTVQVSGQFVAPDGQTPLVNATVYVPTTGASRLMSARATGDGCVAPDVRYSRLVCTDEQGRFVMSVPADSLVQLVAMKGVFSYRTEINTAGVLAGGTLDIGTFEPLMSGDMAPRFAVVTGSFDRIEDVLAKSGISEAAAGTSLPPGGTFKRYNGDGSLSEEYPGFRDLFADRGDGKPVLHNYDTVFINCGVSEYEVELPADTESSGPGAFASIGVDPLNPYVISALRTYVSEGGRLYLTDQAYDYLEQTFPEFIDFQGSDDTAATTAENLDEAETGLGDIVLPSATVLDSDLSAFLGNVTCDGDVACLNPDGTLHIEGFLGGWAVMEGAHPAAPPGLTFYVSGAVSTDAEAEVVKPLTAAFPYGQGKVFYSSYHTENLANAGFLPQERVLQFLVFE